MKLLKKLTALLLTMALALSLAACNAAPETKKDIASTQSVSMIMGLDMNGVNRFGGVAEAKSSQKVQKDSEKTVAECLVEVGQEVKKGDVLFRYDVEAMRLSVETAKLELEQLQNQIKSYNSQLTQLQKEKKSASKSEQLSYTLQIQETELNLAEAEYNLKQKQAEVKRLEESTENADVCAEVDGVVQSINEGGNDFSDYGSSDGAYITIMETGTFRIKGTVSETGMAYIYEGMEVTVQSRTHADQMWSGTISEINYGSTEEENSNNGGYYDNGGGGDTASKYSFYVTLEDSEGMMMGQHFYILPYAIDRSVGTGVVIPESFVVDAGGNAYVWAASSKDTLEKRYVTLGFHDEMMMTYAIESGLTVDDYIADPAAALTEGQQVVKYDASSYGFNEDGVTTNPEEGGDFGTDFPTEGGDIGELEGGNFGEEFPAEGVPEDDGFSEGEMNTLPEEEMTEGAEPEMDIAAEAPVMEG